MDLNISVVHVDVEEAEQYDLFEALFKEYSSTLSIKVEPNIVRELFELPYFHGFISFAENKPAAFAVCFESFSTYRAKKALNIHDFMVSESYRGQGIGKALLNGIEQYCHENDYFKITLEVDDDNTAAKKLYSSCDFENFQVVLKDLLHWQKYLI